jgi:hypothetical protein
MIKISITIKAGCLANLLCMFSTDVIDVISFHFHRLCLTQSFSNLRSGGRSLKRPISCWVLLDKLLLLTFRILQLLDTDDFCTALT